MEYTEKALVGIAKRENNKRRNYLVVNRLQGKHIAVSPSEALCLFGALADTLRGEYSCERLLFIGFAETATAIGAAVAHRFGAHYLTTTREAVPGVTYLFFSEEHSHAAEQKLVKEDMDSICGDIDRIVFVEDEVTTGKTIDNIIRILRKNYPQIKGYSIASLLNGMDGEALDRCAKNGIGLHYLVKTDHASYGVIAEKYRGDGEYIDETADAPDSYAHFSAWEFGGCVNARRMVHMEEYDMAIDALRRDICENIAFADGESVLVLGTEEFMYPALCIAGELEKTGVRVCFHATTRSPIAVSSEREYPLHKRYRLKSFYDATRTTYVYDLARYDHVLVLTDAGGDWRAGAASLANALRRAGNENIDIIRWTRLKNDYKTAKNAV